MKRLKTLILGLGFAFFVAAPVFAVAIPASSVNAAPTADSSCEQRFLGAPTWFRGMAAKDANDKCFIMSPEDFGGIGNFIWRIALNIIEMGLFIAGYLAVFFILFGGFQFLTGGGNPGQIEKARKTILNAVIGLVISMASIAVTNLIFGLLG